MHELFLCDVIPEGNLQQVMRMLQGYCGMSPVSFIRREQIWEGPRNRNALKSLDQNFIQKQNAERQKQWRHLSEALSRQAYVLTLSYEIGKSSFGEAEGKGEDELVPIEFDKIPGTLRWNDVPDTISARPTTNGRPIVEIANERSLHIILKSINHRFAREFIREGYRFVHGHVLFELFRMIPLHPQGEISNLGNPLPSYESLTLFDTENQWALMASVKVDFGVERTELGQKLNRQATDELIGVKTAFEGSAISLKVTDRLSFDTRVKGS